MLASIVIPTYFRHDLLLRVISAVCQQDFPADQYEVLIADDGNCSKTRALVESIAEVSPCNLRYVPVDPAHGPAAARNCAWREAVGEIIAFTDDDCVPDPRWLAEGVKLLSNQSTLAAAWGKLEMPLPCEPTDYERDAAGLAQAVFVTANCFVRRSALLVVGGFDERFKVAWREDSDLYYSLLENGFSVGHASKALVVHPIRPAAWGVSIRQQYKSRFDVLLYRKHPTLYKKHVPAFPKLYILIVLTGLSALATLVGGWWLFAMVLAVVSIALSIWFACLRLRNTRRSIQHVTEMLVTSLVIPWLAVWHRLAGWWKYA